MIRANIPLREWMQSFKAQIDVCDEDFFQDLGAGGHSTKDPIFILGLPRAGSTLIEQISSITFYD